MHVLYIHQHFATRAGSSGTRSYEFARYMVECGHKVSMLCGYYDRGGITMRDPGRRWEHQSIDGIDVYIVNLRYSNYQSFLWRVWVFAKFILYATWLGCRLKNLDVIFATSTPLTVGAPGVLISKIRRRPFVFEVRDIWPEAAVALGILPAGSALTWLLDKFASFCYRHARRVVAISPTMKRFLEEDPAVRGKVVVVPIGADLDVPYENTGRWRRELGGHGKFWIAYSGAHGLANELDRVLDAARHLLDQQDIEFLLIGDGRERPRLVERARQEGLSNVRFVPSMSRIELGRLLAEVDACILCLGVNRATAPALPNKFFEYLAAGKPVLVNFPSDAADVVESYGCGRHVDHRSAEYLAMAVKWLRDNPAATREMGRRAKELACGIFERKRMARDFEQVLRAVSARSLSGHAA